MSREHTRIAARGYFEAWTSGGGPDEMRPWLSEQFRLRAGDYEVTGRETFFADAAWPGHDRVHLVAEAYDGPHAFQVYDAYRNGACVRIAEHQVVASGLIASSEIIYDSVEFRAFLEA